MKILMLGIQGSGKGTQAELLSAKFKIPHISSGDLFRALDKTTPLGQKVRSLIDKGEFVPDQLVMKLLDKRLACDDCKNGYILDGFPRNLAQAKEFDKYAKFNYVVMIELSEKEAIRRVSGRRSCSKCKRPYNINTFPKPKKDNICDVCSAPLTQREDETPEALEKRFRIFHEQTMPLVHFYAKQKNLVKVNGEQSIEQVQSDIFKSVKP